MKRSELGEVMREVKETFVSQLQPMVGGKLGLKKRQLEDMKAGCSDGARMCIQFLVQKGFLTIEED